MERNFKQGYELKGVSIIVDYWNCIILWLSLLLLSLLSWLILWSLQSYWYQYYSRYYDLTTSIANSSITESIKKWYAKIEIMYSNSPFSPILEINTFGICSDVTDDATVPKALKDFISNYGTEYYISSQVCNLLFFLVNSGKYK